MAHARNRTQDQQGRRHNPADVLVICVLAALAAVLLGAFSIFSPDTVIIDVDADALYKACGIMAASIMLGVLFWRATDMQFLHRRLHKSLGELSANADLLESTAARHLSTARGLEAELESRDRGQRVKP